MDIPGLPFKDLGGELSKELAETNLLLNDLRGSLASLRLWVQRYVPVEQRDDETSALLNSLFRDAIVQFVACFDPKAAIKLDVDLIYGQDSGASDFLDWLRDIRNAYAAHRYGALRQCVAGIAIDPETGAYVQAQCMRLLYCGPPPADHQKLLQFLEVAVAFVSDQHEAVDREFIASARKLTNEERFALPFAKGYGMDPDESGISRGELYRRRTSDQTK